MSKCLSVYVRKPFTTACLHRIAKQYGNVAQICETNQSDPIHGSFLVVFTTVDDALHAWKYMHAMCVLEEDGVCNHNTECCCYKDNGICISQIGSFPCRHKCRRMTVMFSKEPNESLMSCSLGPTFWNFTNTNATNKMQKIAQMLQDERLAKSCNYYYAMLLFGLNVFEIKDLEALVLTNPEVLPKILVAKMRRKLRIVVTSVVVTPPPGAYKLSYSEKCDPKIMKIVDNFKKLFDEVGLSDTPNEVFHGLIALGMQNEEDLHFVLTENPHELGEINISKEVLGKLKEHFKCQ